MTNEATVNIEALIGNAVSRNPGKITCTPEKRAGVSVLHLGYDPCGQPSLSDRHCKSATISVVYVYDDVTYEDAHAMIWRAMLQDQSHGRG